MKIADQRHGAIQTIEALADMWHCRRRLRRVDGQAHQLRAGLGQRLHLCHRAIDVRRIGVGHRLDEHWRAVADKIRANAHTDTGMALAQRDSAVHEARLLCAENFFLGAVEKINRRSDGFLRALHQIRMADILVNDHFAAGNIVRDPLGAGARAAGFHGR